MGSVLQTRRITGILGALVAFAACQERTAARDAGPLPHSSDLADASPIGGGTLILSDAGRASAADAAPVSPPDAGAATSADAATSAGYCPLPGCPETSLPAGTDLAGVWAGPAGEVWAVGEGGMIGRREPDAAGGTWCWCAAGTDASLNAVWGTGSDDVWIVGDGGHVLHFGGSGFDPVDVHSTAALADVWGTSAQSLFVVGDQGVARHFDGSTWRNVDVGGEHQLFGVWGAGADAIWAVGRVPLHGTYEGAEAEVYRWTSGAWVKQIGFAEERGAAAFNGVSGTGPDDVWAVGTKFPSGAAAGFAFAAHFDGTTWSAMDAPEDARIGRNYTDVTSTARGSAWITASGDSCVRVDGSAWSAGDASTTNLLAIDKLWATGRDGKVLRRSASSAWSVDLPATPAP
jgi:hypothetical protein